MGALDRKALLAKEELKREKVDLGKGDFVYVRQMTAHEHSVYTMLLAEEKPVLDEKGKATGATEPKPTPEDWPSKLAASTMCDEKGELILQPGDWETLSQNMTGVKLDKIASAAVKLNKMGAADQEAKVKNSGGGKAADSSSDSA